MVHFLKMPGLKEHLKELVPRSLSAGVVVGGLEVERPLEWKYRILAKLCEFNWGHLLRFWLRSSFWGIYPSWLFVINSFAKKKISKTNAGGIWRDFSCSFNTFPWKRFRSVFFWGGENKTSKITEDFFPKNSRLLFFFCGDFWGKAAEVDRSFGRWGDFEETRSVSVFLEFWVLTLCCFFFFAESKDSATLVTLLIVGLGQGFEVVLESAGKKQTNLQQIPKKSVVFHEHL